MTIFRRRNGAAVLEENATSVASGRTMEAIAAGEGKKPKAAVHNSDVQADAGWDSTTALPPKNAKVAELVSEAVISVRRPSSTSPRPW
jgi:bifunctional non-homologous end joining protein LigD